MKKLFFTLSLFSLHSFVFSVQEADHAKQFQEQDVTPEYFEQQLQYPVTRSETEENILFFGIMKACEIRALLEKKTGVIRVDDIITIDNGYELRYERGEIIVMQNPCSSRFQPSRYSEFSQATYNALQALYEKQQQEEGKQNS